MADKRPEEALFSASVKHQIHLSRLAAGLRNRAVAEITEALTQLADDIERLHLGDVRTRAQLGARLESLEVRFGKRLDRVQAKLEADLRDIADEEAGFMSRLWARTIGSGV